MKNLKYLLLTALLLCSCAQSADIGSTQSALSQTITFTLIRASDATIVSGYDPLVDGATLTLSQLPTGLSIRGNPSGTVGSMVFKLDSDATHSEGSLPLSLCGDNVVSYTVCPHVSVVGSHTLEAKTYSGASGTGTLLGDSMISFVVQTTSTNNPPTISSFTASPSTINLGSSTTLAWTTVGATSLSIDNGVGTVTGSSASVSPTTSTTYTLTATNAYGTVTSFANVTVNIPAVTISVSPTPTTVASLGTQQFAATVSNTTNTSVTWAMQEPGTSCGSVSSTGLYTAPTTDCDDTFCHVIVTSVADSTKSATATIHVSAYVAPTDGGTASNLSAGCGMTGVSTGTFHIAPTDGNGTTRDAEVMVPSSYVPTAPLRITVLFHGAAAGESQSAGWGLQNVTGAAASSVFVFPQGINYQTYGVGWDDACNGRDMVFFDHILATIEANYCIDTSKVFVAGFSWGCDFSTALACCRGDRIRAIGAASCSDDFLNPADYTSYVNGTCPVTNKAAFRFTHDAAGDGAYTAQEFTTTSTFYRALNSCSSSSTATSPSPCISYNSCLNSVVECAYSGLGHALPSNWATDTWSFFSQF